MFVRFPFLACNCDEDGVIDDGRCDNNGTCNCKVGTDPPKCSMCASGYWNFSLTNSNGCQGNFNFKALAICPAEVHTSLCIMILTPPPKP